MSSLVEWRTSLPSQYVILGLTKSDGLVFLTKCSAMQWLLEQGLPPQQFSIIPTKTLYYPGQGSGSRFKTTEEIVSERNEGLDTKSGG